MDIERLDEVLAQVGEVLADLHVLSGKPGQHVRDNDWLGGIKNRTSIPGGTCSFDLPSYHAWLSQNSGLREADLMTWLSPLLPYRKAVGIVLRLLRERLIMVKIKSLAVFTIISIGCNMFKYYVISVGYKRACTP